MRTNSKRFSIFILGAIVAADITGFTVLSNAQEAGKVKTETEQVNIDVVVTDRAGQRVLDLKKGEFEIYEDGVLQEITHFQPVNQPLRLIFLFDVSVSMGAVLPMIKDEAVKLIDGMRVLDELMIASFSRTLIWHTDWSGKALATTEILDLKSASIPWQGPRQPYPIPPGRRVGLPDRDTNLYGALHSVFERFGKHAVKEIVVLISDGKDAVEGDSGKQRPINDPKQVVREAQESWVQVHSACFKSEREPVGYNIPTGGRGKSSFGSNCKFLSEVTTASGGRTFEFELQSELALILRKTLDELRSKYTLSYSPLSQGKKAGFHSIKVVAKRPDLVARAREGYLSR